MMGVVKQIDHQQLAALVSRPPARRISGVHLHHSWRPAHVDWRGQETIEAIRRFHIDVLGWDDIGQHLSIGPDGTLWTGRDRDAPPASASGHNGSMQEGPLMIVLIGDFDLGRDSFDGAQAQSTYAAMAAILTAYQLAPEALRFFSEFNPAKTSPGTSLGLVDFRAEVKKTMTGRSRRTRATPGDAQAGAAYLSQFSQMNTRRHGRAIVDAEPAEPRYDAAQATHQWRAARDARFLGRCECSDAEREIFRSHVVNLAMGQLSNDGCYNNSESDLDELVARIGNWIALAPHPRLMFFAHGGLVDERDGLGIAIRDHHWWLANGVYPVFFVWETGFLEVFRQKQRELAARGFFAEAGDALLEITLGPTVGKPVWNRIKTSALLSSAADTATGFPGGAHRFASKLAARLKVHAAAPGAKPIGLHAVGHSAGAIFHCHYLPVLTSALTAVGAPNATINTLALLAPAARVDLFKSRLMPLVPAVVGKFALFTMNRAAELDDAVIKIYCKSLLYFVRNACEEPVHATPILGLEESVRSDTDLAAWFGLTGSAPAAGVDVVWSPTDAASGPSASRSRSHGDFDNDASTMNAVMYRILGLPASAELPLPHLGDAEVMVCGQTMRGLVVPGADPATVADHVGAARAGGQRRALAIGIDSYSTQPLSGCVADARSVGAALAGLGFEIRSLFDAEATRRSIETAIDSLFTQSKRGDTVVIHYAGHGTQLPDLNQDEGDGFDEAWVPFDYMEGEFFIDDDQGKLFDRYRAAGIELVLFTDCCHSGTSTRAAFTRNAPQTRTNSRYLAPPPQALQRFRELRGGASRAATGRATPADALGWEIHYSACRDTQSAYEHDGQGDFTRALVGMLASAAQHGTTYEALAERIAGQFASNVLQSPGLRAQPPARIRALFGDAARTDGVASDPATGVVAAAPIESRELARRIDAIDVKLDALTRKFDSL